MISLRSTLWRIFQAIVRIDSDLLSHDMGAAIDFLYYIVDEWAFSIKVLSLEGFIRSFNRS